MKKKKSIIIIVCVLLVVAISAGFGVYTYIKTENENAKAAINAEIDAINKMLDDDSTDFNKEELYKLLDNRVVTKGKYAIIEDAAKKYMKDFYDNGFEVLDLVEDEQFVNLLTIENIKSDGPEFKKSKEYIAKGKELIEKSKEIYTKMNTKETMNSYVEGKGLNKEQLAFYESIFAEWFDEYEDNEYFDAVDDIDEYLSVAEKAIDLLSKNKDSWKIENGLIYFNSQKVLNEYNKIILELH